MDSSSDGDFAWTDASDDTTDIEMAKTDKNVTQSGEESESGKSYKKKLQQQLFSGDDNGIIQRDAHHKKKRKHGNGENIESSKKKKIKMEPESDVDMQVKKKYKHSEISSKDVSEDNYDDSYLELKVKKEQSFAIPSPSPVKIKKSKSKHVSSVGDSSLNNGEVEGSESHTPLNSEIKDTGYSKTKIVFEDEFSHTEGNSIPDSVKSQKKKKAKKKREASENENSFMGSFSSEETVAAAPSPRASGEPTNNGPHEPSYHSGLDNGVGRIPNGNVAEKGSESQPESSCSASDKNTKRRPTISERLKFEDEDDSDLQTKTIKTPIKKAKHSISKLKHFIESSINLRPFCMKHSNASILTEDDDLWLIKCPKEVRIEDFQDKKWTLDSKCKIKLDSQTYEGDVDDKKMNMAIVSSGNNGSVIKNLRVNGCVRLRRRIPKAHTQEDNVMVNNRSNFIPLPETKCRHPLFGLHYKKAIKLPSAVAERLRVPHTKPTISPQIKRKKKSRRQMDSDEVSFNKLKVEPVSKSKPAVLEDEAQTMSTSKKKKKKRKHSETVDEPSAPHPKRIKHDPASAEAWESEKAIEENLFNF